MGRLKIAIVDDEDQILKALDRELSAFAEEKDLDLLLFNSPVSALKKIKELNEDIALIISDQKMPVMKGCDLFNEVKKINPDIVSILLTAYTDINDIIKTIRTGLFSFILKPWDFDHLILEVEKGLDLYRLRSENKLFTARLNEGLKWGGELQKKVLKKTSPDDSKLDFSVTYYPVPDYCCGGDYYDILQFDEDRYIVLIGDVSGHGIKAAFITFILKTILNPENVKEVLKQKFSPSLFLKWLNNRVCSELSNIDSIIITFCACMIDFNTNTITAANAGHIPPRIIRDDVILPLNVSGTAMGFQKNIKYKESSVVFKKNDQLLLFTDGLSDEDIPGKAIDDVLLKHRTESDYTAKVIDDILELSAGSKFTDDMTLISVKLFPESD